MAEVVDGRPRTDAGGRRPRLLTSPVRLAAALALLTVSLLMLVHWLTYRVTGCTTPADAIPFIPRETAGVPEARPPSKSEVVDWREDCGSGSLFDSLLKSIRAAAPRSATSLAPAAPADASGAEPSTQASPSQGQASPSPTPAGAVAERPNFLLRFFRWLLGPFRRRPATSGGSSASQPVIQAVSLSTQTVRLVPKCPEMAGTERSCPTGEGVVRVSVSAADADGDRLVYRFNADAGSVRVDAGGAPSAEWDLNGVRPGVYELSVVAVEHAPDSEGFGRKSAPRSVRLTVEECRCILPALPTLSVESPLDVALGKPVTFNAVTSGGDPGAPLNYKWSVSAGRIVSGQGTSRIVVDTTGLPAGTDVTATVEISRYAPAASSTTRLSTPVDVLLTVRGVITDPSGGVVPRAVVSVHTPAGSQAGSGTTGEDGTFSLTLRPGEYLLVVKKGDFVTSRVFTVGQGDSTSLDITLPMTMTTPTPTTSPTPPPTPAPGASPSPSPSPAPDSSPTPTPGGADAGQRERLYDQITVNRPARFLKEEARILSCELAMVRTFVNPQEDPIKVIDKPSTPEGGRPGPLAESFGEGYTSSARCVLGSDDLDFNRLSPEGQPVPAAADQKARWDWEVLLKDGSRDTLSFTLWLDVVWSPKKPGGGPDIVRRVWERKFINVPVDLPLDVKVSKYGSIASGLAALGVVVLPGRRRKRPEEIVEDEEVAAGDEVVCTVFAPEQAAPGDPFEVQVFAHLAGEAWQLASIAAKADAAARDRGSRALPRPVERGMTLAFRLEMQGLEVPEPEQSLTWNGRLDYVQFAVDVPADCEPKNVRGVVRIFCEGAPVGRIMFMFKVVAREQAAAAAPAPAPLRQRLIRYRHAFVSYSSKDRPRVLLGVIGLEKGLKWAGITTFIDVRDIDSGESWSETIRENLERSDLFVLFWSNAARDSDEVKKEIAYALGLKQGNDEYPPFFEPFTIELPLPQPLPGGLESLHFSEELLFIIKAEEEIRARQSADPAAPGPPPAP